MEILLLGIYCFFVWLIFIKFKLLPWTTPFKVAVAIIPVVALATMMLLLNIFALTFVPVALIVVFWMVHVLPEKIAHKRHHPQLEAIKTLCLLSLVFGGLLWPIAWLWAYTKPVGYKLAYGTDKHPDYFKEHGLPEPESPVADIKQRLATLEASSDPASELEAIRSDLAALEARLAANGSGAKVS